MVMYACIYVSENVITENGGRVHTYPFCEVILLDQKGIIEECHQNAIDAIESISTVRVKLHT